MSKRLGVLLAAGALIAPLAAVAPARAQATREGNIWDYKDHQPTAGVQSDERAAGVAPDSAKIQNENRSLDAMNKQLMQRARNDARANPSAVNNVYGVKPGGVVQVSPAANAAGAGGAGGAGAGGGGAGGAGAGGAGAAR